VKYVVCIRVENKVGVLARIAGQFVRRAINIERLLMRPDELSDSSDIIIEYDAEERSARTLLKSLERLIDVTEVRAIDADTDSPFEDVQALLARGATLNDCFGGSRALPLEMMSSRSDSGCQSRRKTS
jgi:acetolactate synthase small subunit